MSDIDQVPNEGDEYTAEELEGTQTAEDAADLGDDYDDSDDAEFEGEYPETGDDETEEDD